MRMESRSSIHGIDNLLFHDRFIPITYEYCNESYDYI